MIRALALAFTLAVPLSACQTSIEPREPDPDVEPSQVNPAIEESDSFSGGRLHADQLNLDLQENHPNGSQLIVSAIRFDNTSTTVDLTVINGSEYRIALNRYAKNMKLLDNLGNEYFVVPPPDNEDIEMDAGEQLQGSFNFAGRLHPEATSVTLITSARGGGSRDSQYTRSPEFHIRIPLGSSS